MKIKNWKCGRLVVAALIVGCSLGVSANKQEAEPIRKSVGEAVDYALTPDLSKATRAADGMEWTHTISHPGASFLKVHFTNFNLRAGDSVSILTGTGRKIESLTLAGPKSRMNFWGLSAQGDTTELVFRFNKTYDKAPFNIDKVIIGDDSMFGVPRDSASRSICSPADFEDAICYENDPGKWDNVQASVGVMSVGGNANTALFCSGSNVSPNNVVLTNQHCVETQAVCDNTEFVFKYYRTECGTGAAATQDWQSFRCDTILASEPFINCDAGPGDLDFTLATVQGDPASTFGYAQVDTTPLTSGEEIYIVQHPSGRPHEITIGSGADVVVDNSVLRYYTTLDTEGGSSGSPIFRASDDKLIGLHHCGGCSTAGVGNRGMLMTDIGPLIEEYLCSNDLELTYSGISNLLEVNGNGDTVIDPGETWSFEVSARNNSCGLNSTAATGQVALNAGVGGTVILSNQALTFGDIAAGETATSGPVTFEVATDFACGSQVILDLTNLADNSGGTSSDVLAAATVDVGSVPLQQLYTESFDGGIASWTITDLGTGTGPAQTWTDTNPGNRSLALTEPYIIVDSDEHGSGLNMDESIVSQPIDVTGLSNISLTFNHEFRYYTGGNSEQADVEVRSTATAGAWVLVQNFSGGSSSGAVSIDITPYQAADLQIRFHYHNATFEWWWAIDDVMIVGDEGFVCNVFGSLDSDGDGVNDDTDNCTLVANASQLDSNGDGIGNACDADTNNDCIVNFLDFAVFPPAIFSEPGDANWNPDVDFDGNNVVNFLDQSLFPQSLFSPPGPSANGCEVPTQ